MNKNMREGFEDHIAKQQKLEGIPKKVLAVQLFAMKDNLDYIDEKLQTKWVEWRSACSQQIEKDAGLCDANTIKFPPCTCAENIRNQENE